MAHPFRRNSRPLTQSNMSLLAKFGRDLETEARMITASLWAPLKRGLEAMLRFGLRSDINATITDRYPWSLLGVSDLRPDPSDEGDRKPSQPRRTPKRFLAARHGDE